MDDIEQNQDSSDLSEDGFEERSEEKSLGSLLKDERTRLGLSYERVTELTRLRRPLIESLEKDKWEDLPPPVFVKGFLKSYARILELDEKKVLELYESAAPQTSDPRTVIDTRPQKRKWLVPILLLSLCLVAVIMAIMGYRLFSDKRESLPSESPPPVTPEVISEAPARTQQAPSPAKPSDELGKEPSQPEEVEDNDSKTDAPVEDKKEAIGFDNLDVPTELPLVRDEPMVAPERPPEPVSIQRVHVLKGIVNLRTWIKICIDDQGPQEYIFEPGSQPQWESRDGFFIIIGNAAGIELEFNGNQLKDLGKPGRVVHLRLPENFETSHCED